MVVFHLEYATDHVAMALASFLRSFLYLCQNRTYGGDKWHRFINYYPVTENYTVVQYRMDPIVRNLSFV